MTVGAIGAVLVAAGSSAQAGWLFVLAAGVFALAAASVMMPPGTTGLEVRRRLPAKVQADDAVPVVLELRNRARRASPLLRVEDNHPAFEPHAVLVEPFGPGGAGAVETVRRALRRGVYAGGEVVVTGGGPFGLARSRRVRDVPGDVVVVPRTVELGSFPILEPSSFPAESLHERARTGAGQDYLGVREYRRGDPLRHVHWRSSARIGRLVVREYEEPAQSRVVMLLAGADAGRPPGSAFETLVSACASVARYALVTGHPIDLIRAGPHGPERILQPDTSAMLEWLAAARPVDAGLMPLLPAGLERVTRRGTMVLFCTSGGRADAELEHATAAGQAAGVRTIAVVARSSSWDPARAEPADLSRRRWGDRALLRVLERDEDVARCLHG